VETLKTDFTHLYIDITDKCNMRCNICFPNDKFEIIDLSYFEEVCKRLEKRKLMRFIGGEPTCEPKLFDYIRIARKYGHLVSFSTNGLKLSDESFTKKLPNNMFIHYSMNGGIDDNVYKIIDNKCVLDKKLAGLETLERLNFKNICLGAIIVRGINETTITNLIDLSRKFKCVKHIHFRNALAVGRNKFSQVKPYSLDELNKYVEIRKKDYFTVRDCTKKCCVRFRADGINYSLMQWPAPACFYRGRLLKDFKFQQYFEHMMENYK